MKKIHYISGLPRSGSTLLVSILNQNPKFFAEITTPLMELVTKTCETNFNDPAYRIINPSFRLKNTLNSMMLGFYEHIDKNICFNTHRCWPAITNYLNEINPQFKIICMVRSFSDVLNSMENIFSSRGLTHPHNTYPGNAINNVWERTNYLVEHAFVGTSYRALREAYFSKYKNHLLLIEYDDIVFNTSETIKKVYDFIEEPHFNHNFDHVTYSYKEYDDALSLRNLHKVNSSIKKINTPMVLPPELYKQYESWNFWR